MTTIEIARNEIAGDLEEAQEIKGLLAHIKTINPVQLKGLRTRYFEGRVTGPQMVLVRNEEGRRA